MIKLDAKLVKYVSFVFGTLDRHGFILAEPHAYSDGKPRVFVVEDCELIGYPHDDNGYLRPVGPNTSIFSSYNDAYDYCTQQGWSLILEAASAHD